MANSSPETSASETPEFSYKTDPAALLLAVRSATKDVMLSALTEEKVALVQQANSVLEEEELKKKYDAGIEELTPGYDKLLRRASGKSETLAIAKEVLRIHRKCTVLVKICEEHSTSDSHVHLVSTDSSSTTLYDANDSDVSLPEECDDLSEEDIAMECLGDPIVPINTDTIADGPDSEILLTDDGLNTPARIEDTETQKAAGAIAPTMDDVVNYAKSLKDMPSD